jgi:DNA replication protein
MRSFAGFPAGRLSLAALPDLLFSEWLPLIDDLAELKVSLHVLWVLGRRQSDSQCASLCELLADGLLLASLQSLEQPPEAELRRGLDRAVTRGTLLSLAGTRDSERFYFVNSSRGRKLYERALQGELDLAHGQMLTETAVPGDRPNIFALYEQNIGLLQPIIAEELQEAERTYPQRWVEEAFRIAVENNVRNWKYIRRILERWAAEGKDSGEGGEGGTGWYQEYGELIKR